MKRCAIGCVLALTCVSPMSIAAGTADPIWIPPELDLSTPKSAETLGLPLRSGEWLEAEPFARLPRAVEAEPTAVADMVARNASGELPVQNGFARALAGARQIVIEPLAAGSSRPKANHGVVSDTSAAGGLVAMLRVEVEGAWGVRLHLEQVNLPKDVSMWVYAPGEQAYGPFDLRSLSREGDLWCPTVFGEVAWLEVEVPASAAADDAAFGFVVGEVMELFPPAVLKGADKLLDPDMSCLVDAMCVSSSNWGFDGYERAVTFLIFSDGGSSYICSGGMLVDSDTSTYIPYVLTANHCFDTQAVATTVDSLWDYYNYSCNGTTPSLGSLPRVTGATLLATSDFNDFTFIRLSSRPSNRLYLGWSETPPTHGTMPHRISHPDGEPQMYSRSSINTAAGTCTGIGRPQYLYSTANYGGTFGGSSGSPVILYDGYVVGQLRGGCGPDPAEGCDYSNSEVDGAFSETFQHVSPWLSPGSSDCVSSISLNQTVNGTWTSACASTHRCGAYAKYYTFSLSSSTDVQIDLSSDDDTYLILLNGSGTGGTVIESDDDGGSGSDSRITRTLGAGAYTIEATTYYETTTGSFTLGLQGSGGGGGGGGTCTESSTTLCLNDNRFKVQATYQTQQGQSGSGRAVELTSDTGYFWFFNQDNVEMVIKVLDGCGVNGKIWVYAGGLTNVKVTMTVTDMDNGTVKTYNNPQGTPFQPIQDSGAFATCP